VPLQGSESVAPARPGRTANLSSSAGAPAKLGQLAAGRTELTLKSEDGLAQRLWRRARPRLPVYSAIAQRFRHSLHPAHLVFEPVSLKLDRRDGSHRDRDPAS